MRLGIALLPRGANARLPDDRELSKSEICDSDFGHPKRGSDSRCCVLNGHEPADLARDADDQLFARERLTKKGFNAIDITGVPMGQNAPFMGVGDEGREFDANKFVRMSCVHETLQKQPGFRAT